MTRALIRRTTTPVKAYKRKGRLVEKHTRLLPKKRSRFVKKKIGHTFFYGTPKAIAKLRELKSPISVFKLMDDEEYWVFEVTRDEALTRAGCSSFERAYKYYHKGRPNRVIVWGLI